MPRNPKYRTTALLPHCHFITKGFPAQRRNSLGGYLCGEHAKRSGKLQTAVHIIPVRESFSLGVLMCSHTQYHTALARKGTPPFVFHPSPCFIASMAAVLLFARCLLPGHCLSVTSSEMREWTLQQGAQHIKFRPFLC